MKKITFNLPIGDLCINSPNPIGDLCIIFSLLFESAFFPLLIDVNTAATDTVN